MTYIVQAAPKSHCPKCGQSVDLLCDEQVRPRSPMFYICWTCHEVSQVGVGLVKRDGECQAAPLPGTILVDVLRKR